MWFNSYIDYVRELTRNYLFYTTLYLERHFRGPSFFNVFFMLMFIKKFQSEKFVITAEMENNSEYVSFDRCFIINTPDILPKSFKIRDDRVYCKAKLKRYDNVLLRVECSGKVTFRNLQRFMPSVFDFKHIRKMNEKTFIKDNFVQILRLSGEVIGKEKAEQILKEKVGECE